MMTSTFDANRMTYTHDVRRYAAALSTAAIRRIIEELATGDNQTACVEAVASVTKSYRAIDRAAARIAWNLPA